MAGGVAVVGPGVVLVGVCGILLGRGDDHVAGGAGVGVHGVEGRGRVVGGGDWMQCMRGMTVHAVLLMRVGGHHERGEGGAVAVAPAAAGGLCERGEGARGGEAACTAGHCAGDELVGRVG